MHRLFSHSIKIAGGVLALLSANSTLLAQGAPPMNTNDPDTPGNGHWELNFAATHTRTSSGHETELPIFDFNYGVGENIQVSYAIAWLSAHENGAGTESGPTNSAVGAKWRFQDGEKGGIAASVYPQLEFNNPGSSSERKGLADAGATLSLPVQLQRDFAGCTVGLEAGYVLHAKRANEWFYGVSVGHDFTESLTLGVELFGNAANRFDRSSLLLNFGANFKVNAGRSLLVGVGRELHRHVGDKATFVGFLGWQVRL